MGRRDATPEVELRSVGLRATEKRARILEIIRRRGPHLDAEEIYAAAREEDADVSLATVYRTVRALRRAGLVEQRYFGPEHSHEHYEATGGPEHYHFTCRRCGRVFEFETPAIERLREDLARRHRWDIRRAFLTLEGVCPDCLEAPAS
jgi:Fur family ferric uptake transcriptional regulator